MLIKYFCFTLTDMHNSSVRLIKKKKRKKNRNFLNYNYYACQIKPINWIWATSKHGIDLYRLFWEEAQCACFLMFAGDSSHKHAIMWIHCDLDQDEAVTTVKWTEDEWEEEEEQKKTSFKMYVIMEYVLSHSHLCQCAYTFRINGTDFLYYSQAKKQPYKHYKCVCHSTLYLYITQTEVFIITSRRCDFNDSSGMVCAVLSLIQAPLSSSLIITVTDTSAGWWTL